MPCSAIGPETSTRSPGRAAAGAALARGVDEADAGGADVHAVRRAAADDLGVAGDDRHPGRARRRGGGLDLGAQHLAVEALLEHQRERQRERLGADHREVVDRAVDGELADRAAGEAQRPHDEAVGRDRHRGAADVDDRGVGERRELLAAERRHEQAARPARASPCRRRRGRCVMWVSRKARGRARRALDPRERRLLAGVDRARRHQARAGARLGFASRP